MNIPLRILLSYALLALLPVGLSMTTGPHTKPSAFSAWADDDGGGGGDDGGSGGSGSSGGSSGSSGGGGGGDDGGGDSDGGGGGSGGGGGTGGGSVGGNSRSGGGPLALQPTLAPLRHDGGSILRGEVLGIDLSRNQLSAVAALGFTVIRSAALSELDLSYNRLAVPRGMSEVQALALLNREVTPGRFALHHTYRLTQGERACTGQRCVGRQLIRWNAPQAARCAVKARLGMVDTQVSAALSGVPPQRLRTRSFHGAARAYAGHGSAVAALLAGSEHAVPGLLPDAQLFAADVFAAVQGGGQVSSAAFIAEALDWLLAQDVNVINMSLAGPHNPLLQAAVERALAQGVVVVASVGNNGPRAAPAYPAAYAQAIAVTAVDARKRLYRNANRGRHITLAAPGVRVFAPTEGAGQYHTGTSFAAPFVSASVAVLQARGATDTAQLRRALQASTTDLGPAGADPLYGWGLLNAPDPCAR